MKQFIGCLIVAAFVASLVSLPLQQPAVHVQPKTSHVGAAQAPAKARAPVLSSQAPAPVVAPQADPLASKYTPACAQYLPLVEQYDWPVPTAMAIMQAENRSCNPAIDNAGLNYDGTTDYGLFQVNSIHADMVGGNLESLRTPAVNVEVAYKLSHHGTNWTAWSTYNSGKYLGFMR